MLNDLFNRPDIQTALPISNTPTGMGHFIACRCGHFCYGEQDHSKSRLGELDAERRRLERERGRLADIDARHEAERRLAEIHAERLGLERGLVTEARWRRRSATSRRCGRR
jgi:hypothetical protein